MVDPRIHRALPYPACDHLGVLGAEIDDGDCLCHVKLWREGSRRGNPELTAKGRPVPPAGDFPKKTLSFAALHAIVLVPPAKKASVEPSSGCFAPGLQRPGAFFHGIAVLADDPAHPPPALQIPRGAGSTGQGRVPSPCLACRKGRPPPFHSRQNSTPFSKCNFGLALLRAGMLS